MMDRVTEFFAMGGYAAFVWPAYLLATVVLVWLLVSSLRGLRRQEATLKALRGARRDGIAAARAAAANAANADSATGEVRT